MKMTDAEVAARTANAVGKSLYDSRYSDNTSNAESELSGRSYYYTKNTRQRFGSRVLACQPELCGLVLLTVESCSNPTGGRRFRAVIFDLMGTVVHRSNDGLPLDDPQHGGFRKSELAARDGREAVARMGTVRQEARRLLRRYKDQLRSDLKRACAVKV